MIKLPKSLPIMISLALLAFLISPAYSAYSTLDKVSISAPSSATHEQPVQVQATVSTTSNGLGTGTVRDVRTVLILPEGANVTSGDNPKIINEINGGASVTVSWTVVFQKNGTYLLQIYASGYDSNGEPCNAFNQATVIVDGASLLSALFDARYLILVIISVVFLAVLIVVLFRRTRKQGRQTSEIRRS